MFRDVEVVFFDLFYTLIVPKYGSAVNEYDIVGMSRDAWEHIAEDETLYYDRATGAVDDPKEIVRCILDKGQLHATEKTVEEILHARDRRFKDALVNVEEHIISVIKKIKEMGIRICLISNADVIDALNWSASPLCHLFDEVIFSYEVGCVKPDAEIYKMALNRMDIQSEKCLFVGDGGSDELRGAKQLGIRTVMTKEFISRENLLNAEEIDMSIDNFTELLGILNQ